MIILRETEATGYLGRLDQSLQNITNHSLLNSTLITALQTAVKIEGSYIERLMRYPDKKDLAHIIISSSGFPEIPMLRGDIQKAYEELSDIQAGIMQLYLPIHTQARNASDLSDYKNSVNELKYKFEQDKNHIHLLKTLNENFRHLIYEPEEPIYHKNMPDFFYTRKIFPDLLYYSDFGHYPNRDNGSWGSRRGYLKYIDSQKTASRILFTVQDAESSKAGIYLTDFRLYIYPESRQLHELLTSFDDQFRQEFLSVDFTIKPDGSFDEFVEKSLQIAPLLRSKNPPDKSSLQPAVKTPSKHWWKFRR